MAAIKLADMTAAFPQFQLRKKGQRRQMYFGAHVSLKVVGEFQGAFGYDPTPRAGEFLLVEGTDGKLYPAYRIKSNKPDSQYATCLLDSTFMPLSQAQLEAAP